MIAILKLLAVQQIFLFFLIFYSPFVKGAVFLEKKKFHYFGASTFSSTLLAYIPTAA